MGENKKKTYKTKVVNIVRLAKFYDKVNKNKLNSLCINKIYGK